MKVGKEEIAGLLRAVELFFEQDEDALIAEWERRCHLIGEVADDIEGVRAVQHPPYSHRFPPASPLVDLQFSKKATTTAAEVRTALEAGDPSILASGGQDSLRIGPQTLQEGEAELVAQRLRAILT